MVAIVEGFRAGTEFRRLQQLQKQAQQEAAQDRFEQLQDYVKNTRTSLRNIPPDKRGELLNFTDRLLTRFVTSGDVDALGLDPTIKDAMLAQLQAVPFEAPKPLVTKPGDVIRDPQDPTQVIAENPPAAPAEPTSNLSVRMQQLEDALGRPLTQSERLRMAGAEASDQGFTMTFDPKSGEFTLTQGSQGASGTGLTSSQQQATTQEFKFTEQAIDEIDKLLDLPEGSLGLVGGLKRGVREVGRVGTEVSKSGLPEGVSRPVMGLVNLAESMMGLDLEQGTLDQEQAQQFQAEDPLTSAKGLEGRLAYLYARTLQPEGKLLASTINSAKEATKIFGVQSEETARERLAFLRSQMASRLKNIRESVPGQEPSKTEAPTRRFRYNPQTDSLEPVQ